jgi:transposase
VRQATRMKNRIAGLLMETGTPYNKQRLHGKAYFSELLGSLREVPGSVVELSQPTTAGLSKHFCSTIRRTAVASIAPIHDSLFQPLQSAAGTIQALGEEASSSLASVVRILVEGDIDATAGLITKL